MDAVLSLHGVVARALVLYYVAVGVWGLWLGAKSIGPTPNFRGAIAIAVVASIAQGLLGLGVLLFLRGPSEPLHLLYGIALVVAMPLASTLVQGSVPRRQAILLGLAAIFTAGLAIRGITTA